MSKIIHISVLVIFSISTFAQSKWGYSFATANYANNDGTFTEYLFISDVIDISTLDCSKVEKKDSVGMEKRFNRFYAECINLWFYERLKVVNHKAVSNITRQDMHCETGLLPDNMLRYMYGKTLSHLDSIGHDRQSKFMTKKTARKKREDFLKIVNNSNCIAIMVPTLSRLIPSQAQISN